MSNLEPRTLTAAQKLTRLRRAAKNGIDIRKAPVTATDLHQVIVAGTPAQRAAANTLVGQAERRFGAKR